MGGKEAGVVPKHAGAGSPVQGPGQEGQDEVSSEFCRGLSGAGCLPSEPVAPTVEWDVNVEGAL